jgi:ATP-binding cassette, subfamily B, bacterial
MRGLYDVNHVEVHADNRVYDNLHIVSEITSLIPQEPEIFEETMAFNITMGADVPQEQVEYFSKLACFHDIALSLPNAYNTSIKEK